MAISLLFVRRLAWLLLVGAVAVAVSGCTQRDDTNPFISPTSAERYSPFG